MSFGAYNLHTDLQELKNMVDSLPTYLKGDQLYGSVGGGFFTGGRNPNLTIGGILLRVRRLYVFQTRLTDSQLHTLQQVNSAHQTIAQQHTERYRARLEREAHSRLDAILPFVKECLQNPAQCRSIYPPEVLRRTITQEILTHLSQDHSIPTELSQKVALVDRRLRGAVRPADFVWDVTLTEVYPADVFWWMYMCPREIGD
ncbi:MAG: hypothetical protein ACOYLB_10555 [Phototrophicaceae bacterium]